MAKDPRIEHIIVLMLENRSFDHMLGRLYPDKTHDEFHGVQFNPGQYTNGPDPASGLNGVPISFDASWTIDPGPAHEFADVAFQLYGSESSSSSISRTTWQAVGCRVSG